MCYEFPVVGWVKLILQKEPGMFLLNSLRVSREGPDWRWRVISRILGKDPSLSKINAPAPMYAVVEKLWTELWGITLALTVTRYVTLNFSSPLWASVSLPVIWMIGIWYSYTLGRRAGLILSWTHSNIYHIFQETGRVFIIFCQSHKSFSILFHNEHGTCFMLEGLLWWLPFP